MGSLKNVLTVRSRGEKRTAFYPVAKLLAAAMAKKFLRAIETEITEIADCGYRRRRGRRRNRGDERNNTGLRGGFRSGTARSAGMNQRLRAKTGTLKAS